MSEPLARITEDSPLHRFRDYIAEAFPTLDRPPFVRRTGVDFGDALIPSVLFEWPGVQVNVLPQHASASLNLRLLPGDTIEGALEYIRQSIDDKRVNVSALPLGKEASPISSIESTAFGQLHRTISEVYPEVAVAPFVLVGSTDSVHYSDLCDNIYRFISARIAERDTQRFHGIDERIALQDYTDIVLSFIN